MARPQRFYPPPTLRSEVGWYRDLPAVVTRQNALEIRASVRRSERSAATQPADRGQVSNTIASAIEQLDRDDLLPAF